MSCDGGARDSYVAFVRAHTQPLYRLGLALTSHQQQAEDLVQEALLQAFRHWDKVSRADNTTSYVRRILLNVYLAQSRKRRIVESRWSQEENASNELAWDVSDRDPIWQALSSLRARERAAIVLRFYEDMDDEAIADVIGCRPATVRSLVHRGLVRLRENPHLSDVTVE